MAGAASSRCWGASGFGEGGSWGEPAVPPMGARRSRVGGGGGGGGVGGGGGGGRRRRPPPWERGGAERRSRQPPGLTGNERLLDDQRLQELDALLAAVLLRHDRILVLERKHEVVADLEQRGDHSPRFHVAPAGDAITGGAVATLPRPGLGHAVDVDDVLLVLPVLRVRVEDPRADLLDEH